MSDKLLAGGDPKAVNRLPVAIAAGRDRTMRAGRRSPSRGGQRSVIGNFRPDAATNRPELVPRPAQDIVARRVARTRHRRRGVA